MAIPSGSGTEVLKRTTTDGLGNSDVKVIDGEADHIYTVLSIIFFVHTAATIEIKVNPSAGTAIYLVSQAGLANNSTLYLTINLLLQMKIIYVLLQHHLQILI